VALDRPGYSSEGGRQARGSAAWVSDLVLDRAEGTSSLATSLSLSVELLEGRIDAMGANGVH
jgi:hypothetical protein